MIYGKIQKEIHPFGYPFAAIAINRAFGWIVLPVWLRYVFYLTFFLALVKIIIGFVGDIMKIRENSK